MTRLAVICFTKTGYSLMKSMETMISDCRVESDLVFDPLSHKCRALKEVASKDYYEGSVEEWASTQFADGRALLFIGATGIAVRAIAASVKDKLSDSPVLVMDEKGLFVIPLLSGHMGGANVLAEKISSLTGAIPVITTATDLQERFSVDVWAKKNGLEIMNKEGIAAVSSKVLEGKALRVFVLKEDTCRYYKLDPSAIEPVFTLLRDFWKKEDQLRDYPCDILISQDNLTLMQDSGCLWLRPKEYILGIGCKKGKTEAEIRSAIEEALSLAGLSLTQVRSLASIDVKKEEAGMLALAEKERIPFVTYSAEELQAVPGDFHESEFVKSQVGVGSVCERAAMMEGEELILPKQAKDGVTVAIARCRWRDAGDPAERVKGS